MSTPVIVQAAVRRPRRWNPFFVFSLYLESIVLTFSTSFMPKKCSTRVIAVLNNVDVKDNHAVFVISLFILVVLDDLLGEIKY